MIGIHIALEFIRQALGGSRKAPQKIEPRPITPGGDFDRPRLSIPTTPLYTGPLNNPISMRGTKNILANPITQRLTPPKRN